MQKVYGEDVLTNSAFAHYITKGLTVLSSKTVLRTVHLCEVLL